MPTISTQTLTNLYLNHTKLYSNQQKKTVFWVKLQVYKEHEETGFSQASKEIENNDELIICPTITSSKNHQIMVQINKF